MTSKVWFLEKLNLFRLLCPHKFAAYRKSHRFDEYKKDDFIYFNQDSANKIYLIVKGKVKIFSYNKNGDELVKSILSKGEIFGELAVLNEEKREEFAQSLSNSTVCPVGLDTLQELMRDNRDFMIGLHKLIGFRIRKLERRLEQLMFKDVKTRLLEFLQELAEEKGTKNENNNIEIEHHFTQKDIAHLIGSTRQTVSTLLNELKYEGMLIEFNKKKLIIQGKIPLSVS